MSNGNSGGWNRPAANQPNVKKGGAKAPSMWKGIVAGLLIVCALGGLCLWMFSGGEDAPKAKVEKERGRIKEVDPAPAPAPKPVKEAVPKKENPAKKRYEQMKSLTPAERADSNWKRLEETPLNLNVPSNRIFATGTEQIMAWIFKTELGALPPPLPPIPDHELAHFTEILIADNPIGENDSEITADAKETVMAVKKELKNYIKEGGRPDEFFEYYRGQLKQAFDQREDFRKAAVDVIRNDPDIANDFIRQANEKLKEKGIKPLTFNPKMLNHFGVPVEKDENNQ